MKILQLLPELNEGGVERGVVELNREFVRRGHDNVVISAGGRLVNQIVADGGEHIECDVCSKNIFTFPVRVFNLYRLLKTINPDIIHARSRIPAWLAWLANRSVHIPFVTTVHGFNSVNFYSRIMTRGDRVICVSSAIKSYIQKHYRVPDLKIDVIHRGIDPLEFNPESLDKQWIELFRKEYFLEDKFVVSSVGRITELKDYETFIRAIKYASTVIPNIHGLIVGGVRFDKQNYYDSLKKLVVNIGADNLITFAGSRKEIPEINALSQVLVSCSKKPESFGRTMIESMAMGTPVVGTRHGGALDIIVDGETGFLVDPEDVEGLGDAICRCRYLDISRLRTYVLDNFLLDQMVSKTLNVYRKCLGQAV